ncbi:phage tail domain-containing protein [Vagococcus penaei]|uniref:phage tail domain-containing protein n=1 Tax=Vagococcus penaei TaxID=633807 RepID=UPI001475F351|nr:phage tail domain-containing protein [Vagococcus penaei]
MIIEHLNGTTYDFDKSDVRTLDFRVDSPNYQHNLLQVENARGAIDAGSTIGPRDISASFLARSHDVATFSLLRDEIFEALKSDVPFYLTEKRSTNKRWLVKVKSPFDIPQVTTTGKFDVQLIALKGVAESSKTTQHIQKYGLLSTDDSWSFGMGLETVDDSELVYTHTAKNFTIFNAGNVEVHPFESYLKIVITNIQSATSKVSLVNRANGSRIDILKPPLNTETWTFDGPVVLRNSLMAVKDTSKKFLSLAPGRNRIDLEGASSATVSFDFNYLYL